MKAYYNEFDPFAAAWLRVLINEGHIAPGVVDERPIQDVRPLDLEGFTQCHFFAGIGVWSLALRNAGWEDDRPVWTGSCPCQPFSVAGAGGGFDDPRHLWPYFFRLIRQRAPDTVFGEQVDSASAWIDLVQADVEAVGYAFAAVDIPAAGFSAAHKRQRFFWVADVPGARQFGRGTGEKGAAGAPSRIESERLRSFSAMVDPHSQRFREERRSGTGKRAPERSSLSGLEYATSNRRLERRTGADGRGTSGGCGAGLVGNNNNKGLAVRPFTPDERGAIRFEGSAFGETGLLCGCDWLFCQDTKLRPVEPGTFPLAHAAPARVGRLRGYGNAIDEETAENFIAAFLEAKMELD